MTELQKIEFEMLKEFIGICNKLNLKYYLVCGSALGAVKYGGFIPWDDDVDVALPRKDYNKFCEEAQKLLPEYLFLQNHKTDPLFPLPFSKIRDSRTTYVEKSMSHIEMNHGVYIDVFPLDGYPDNEKEIKKFKKKERVLKLKLSCVYNLPYSKKAKILFAFERFLGYNRKTKAFIEALEKLYSQYPIEQSDIICNHGNWQGNLEYAPKHHYGKGILCDFYDIKAMVPEYYDEYLTQKYGDWRADLPDEEKVGHHYYTVCDLKRSYKEYINNQN